MMVSQVHGTIHILCVVLLGCCSVYFSYFDSALRGTDVFYPKLAKMVLLGGLFQLSAWFWEGKFTRSVPGGKWMRVGYFITMVLEALVAQETIS